MVKEHLSGYQARDREIVDYQMYQLAGTELSFRGPEPRELRDGTFFSCVGAAQTLGCFCEHPYPALVSRATKMPALNLGYGGAGPLFFLRHRELIDYVNRGRFAIVQVMSGRSEDNSRFSSGGLEYLTRRSDGRKFSADAAWQSSLELNYYWTKLPVGKAFARRVSQAWGRRQTARLVQETRQNWLRNCRALLAEIRVPKMLLWFSKRTPDYTEGYGRVFDLFGEYPQLVNQSMIDTVRDFCDVYVECVTDRGSPQRLVSRFTGKAATVDLAEDRPDFAGTIWSENAYYPSPEMHEDAARAVLAKLDGLQ